MPKSKKSKKNQKGGIFRFSRKKGKNNKVPEPPPRSSSPELNEGSPYFELSPVVPIGHNKNATYGVLGEPVNPNTEPILGEEFHREPVNPNTVTDYRNHVNRQRGYNKNHAGYMVPIVSNPKSEPSEGKYVYNNSLGEGFNGVGNAAPALFSSNTGYNQSQIEINNNVSGYNKVTEKQAKLMEKLIRKEEAERKAQEAEAKRIEMEKAKEEAEAAAAEEKAQEAEAAAAEEKAQEAEAERKAQEAEAERKAQEAEAERKARARENNNKSRRNRNRNRNRINVNKMSVRPSNLIGKPANAQRNLILRGYREATSAAGGSRKNRTKKVRKTRK